MNSMAATARSVPCPKCGAKVGEDCTDAERWFSDVHVQRILAIPMNGGAIAKMSVKPYYLPGKNPSGYCARHSHTKCSGRHRSNHGMPGVLCTCSCHEKARAAK